VTKRSLQQIEESLRSKLAEQPSRLLQSKSQSIQLNEQGLLTKLLTKWGPDAIELFSKNKGTSRDAAKEEFRKEQLRLANLNSAQRQAEKEALGGQFGVPKKDIKIQEPKLSSELTPQQRVEPSLSGQGIKSDPAIASKPRLSPEPQTTQDKLVQQAQQHLRDTGEQSLIIDSPRLSKILDKLFPEKLSDLSKQRIDPKIDETRLTEAKLDAETMEQLRQNPRVRLMLDLLSRAEGGGKERPTDYDTIVGNLGPKGKRITDFSKHPQITGVTTKHGPSNAAGRYQIVYPTWDGQVKKLAKLGIEIKNFGPESQDKVAIAILNDVGAL
jgi:muramidase (phage lysozyme)